MESLFLLHSIPLPPLTLSLPLCPLQFGSHIWQLNLHIITFASHHPSTLPSHDHEAPGSAAAAQVSTECGILTCYICRLLNIMLFMLICFHSKLSCHTNCTGWFGTSACSSIHPGLMYGWCGVQYWMMMVMRRTTFPTRSPPDEFTRGLMDGDGGSKSS